MKNKSDNKLKEQFTIALTGNPNSGKTTLFNGLTGSSQKIGNWAGVTVDLKEGNFKSKNKDIRIVDLPGIYSMSTQSEDERVSRDFLLSGEVDLVVNIVDAANLERNLYLTTQLLEMNIPTVILLNRYDLLSKKNIVIDLDHLSKHLDVPVYSLSAINKHEIEKIGEVLGGFINLKSPKLAIDYDDEILNIAKKWATKLKPLSKELNVDTKWISLKILEGDLLITEKVLEGKIFTKDEIEKQKSKIESILSDSMDFIIADYRYGFVSGLVHDVVTKKLDKQKFADKIDKIVLNRFLAIPIFLGVMYFMFWFSIVVGGAFIDFFDLSFGTVFVDGFGQLLSSIGSPQWLIAILAGGVGAGVQTVSTFVPIIFSMFLMMSILEDSGYMARAAFIMDRFMNMIGLPGKSFVPMILGFGCSVPAVLATRTLDSKKDRIMSIFMIPFMSCGAKLPVYVLFAAIFFPERSGILVMSLYLAGILMSVLTGLLLKKTIYKGEPSHFVMELPVYNSPRVKHILHHTFNRLKEFIFNAGKIIVIVVTILSFTNSLGIDGTFGNENNEKSVLSKIGKTITPIFEPMGVQEDNWPASVALFTGIFAKEAIVGTLNSLYSQMEIKESSEKAEEKQFNFWNGIGEAFATIPDNLSGVISGLKDPFGFGIVSETKDSSKIAEEYEVESSVFSTMKIYFSNGFGQVYAYLLFILLYFPCVATLGAIVREIGNRAAAIQVVYVTVLAWVASTLFYQITVGRSLFWITFSVLIIGVIILVFKFYGRNSFSEEIK